MLARFLAILSIFGALVVIAASQTTVQEIPPSLPSGQIIDSVTCTLDPTQTYALYLPSAYTPKKSWPVIYAFDPIARGQLPVKLFRDAAEKYGYIIAGSNNSRNFSMEDSSKSARAMWADTHGRFAIDERQVYTTGFSGGARIAGLVALRCTQCKIAGVIAQGAGYPVTRSAQQRDSLLYYLAVGNQDFNWQEVIALAREREGTGQAYRLRVFPGAHRWAPKDVIDDAVQWIRLKAMQSGVQSRDNDFVDDFFRRTQKQASDAEQQHDALAQVAAYRSLALDFKGFREVGEYEKKLDALRRSDELKKALKKQNDQIDQQRSLVNDIARGFGALAQASIEQRAAIRDRLTTGMSQLKHQAEHTRNEEARLVYQRAFNDVYAQGVEAGQAEFARQHLDNAEYYFRLMSEVSPEEPWPVLLLAETHVATGNRKQALKDLREAVKRGLTNPDVLSQDTNLKPLQSDEQFRQLLGELRSQQPTPPK